MYGGGWVCSEWVLWGDAMEWSQVGWCSAGLGALGGGLDGRHGPG